MPLDPQELRLRLDVDEPDYAALSAQVDASDLPTLAALAAGDDAMLASKAVYLASLIPGGADVVHDAARSDDVIIRSAAASGLANVEADRRNTIATDLLARDDAAIDKLTVRALSADATPELVQQVQHLAENSNADVVRDLSRQWLADNG